MKAATSISNLKLFLNILFGLIDGHCLSQGEIADAGAAETAEIGATTGCSAEVISKAPDVGTC